MVDTLGYALDRWMHELTVGWQSGLGLTMLACAMERERGQVSAGRSRGGARVQREAEGAEGWTWSTSRSSMGTIVIYARNVFDTMAARNLFSNFGKLKIG